MQSHGSSGNSGWRNSDSVGNHFIGWQNQRWQPNGVIPIPSEIGAVVFCCRSRNSGIPLCCRLNKTVRQLWAFRRIDNTMQSRRSSGNSGWRNSDSVKNYFIGWQNQRWQPKGVIPIPSEIGAVVFRCRSRNSGIPLCCRLNEIVFMPSFPCDAIPQEQRKFRDDGIPIPSRIIL